MNGAIYLVDVELVKAFIKRGANVNESIPLSNELIEKPSRVVSSSKFSGTGEKLPILYLAIRSYYDTPCQQALEIIALLIENGANLSSACNFVSCNYGQFTYKGLRGVTPLQFAMELTLNLKSGASTKCDMDRLIELLTKESLTKLQSRKQLTKQVPESTILLYKNLLSSAAPGTVTSGDVCFEITSEDKEVVTIFAHRIMLSAASPYFATLLSSQITEMASPADFVIKTKYSLTMIEAMLSFIYTGEVDMLALADEVVDLLHLSVEYDLPPLTLLCEDVCVEKLTAKVVVSYLLLSHRIERPKLKQACITFIRTNSSEMMFNEDLQEVRTSNPDLWSEIGKRKAEEVVKQTGSKV